MAGRPIWIFATPAGHKGTHPGNSSHISVPFQVFSAPFHHWGIFVAERAGDPSEGKTESKSFLSRFYRSDAHTTGGDAAVQGTFFELTRPRDRDIGTLTRTRDVREREEQNNAQWIRFASTGCTTLRTDSDITNIGQHICRERMSSEYGLVGKNCQDWVNLLGNIISVEPWIQHRTLEDIVNRLSWSKQNHLRQMIGHSSEANPRLPFGINSSPTTPNQQGQGPRAETWSLSREDYQAQTLSRAEIPNYATQGSLAVPRNNPTIEMVAEKGFKVVVYSYNGEHRRAVKEVADALYIRPAFSFRKSSQIPVAFSKRQFKDSCLVRLGGENAEIAVDVDFGSFKDGRRPKTIEDVLWYLVDYYKQIRSQPDGYDISYGWLAELRGRTEDTWHLLLRFRKETLFQGAIDASQPIVRNGPGEQWRFAPQSSEPTREVDTFDYWASFRDLDEDMKANQARFSVE